MNKESKRDSSSCRIKNSCSSDRDMLSIQHDTLNGAEHQSIQKMQDPLKTGHRDDTWGKACRALDEEKTSFTPPLHICFFYIFYTLFRSFIEPAAANQASRPHQPLSETRSARFFSADVPIIQYTPVSWWGPVKFESRAPISRPLSLLVHKRQQPLPLPKANEGPPLSQRSNSLGVLLSF